MKERKLKNGGIVPELPEPVTLEVYTKCPEKYMLIDMETGQKYVGHSNPGKGPSHWKKVHDA